MNKPTKDKTTYLQELIIQQGLILENEALLELKKNFGPALSSYSKVSYQIVGADQSTQEVDVFAGIHRATQTFRNPFFNSVDDDGKDLNLEKVMNIFLVECKGNSTEGVLLARLHNKPSQEKILLKTHLSYYEITGRGRPVVTGDRRVEVPTTGRWNNGISQDEVGPIVDSCVFYNFDKDKGYTESRDKLFSATQQITLGTRLFDSTIASWQRDKASGITSFTVTPIICTNIPITVMEIADGEISLTEMDWVYVINPLYGTFDTGPASPDLRIIPVVQSSALARYCNARMSDDGNDLSLELASGVPAHNFNIAQAQEQFRESRKR